MTSRLHLYRGLLLVPLLACIAAAQVAMAAGPPVRDIWYSISDGQQRYGYMNVIVRRLDDGGFEYEVASRLKVELLGTRQEFATKATALVTPDLTPLRMESDVEGLSGRARVRGEAIEDGFVIAEEQEGHVNKSTFSFNDDLGLVFNFAMGDWLHRLLTEMDQSPQPADPSFSRRVRVLAAESGEPTAATVQLVQRDADGSTWMLQPDDQEWIRTTFHLDTEGIMVEQVMTVPPMRIVRASREEAMQIDYRAIPDRELLVFPFDREIPPARRLQQIDVKLTWRNISPEEFELEDARQQLKSIMADGDQHTAIVSLMRPSATRTDTTLPVTAEMFESTLGETNFIQPNDERIATLAREIVGEETSARAAATAICKWVIEYIEPAMVAETLSGTQVLERKTGKCSEYTTLFASLARAAGIPTRIALGQRRFAGAEGDTWGGHMWNEVFVGEWIPVDASVNEVGGSTHLLKFIHSDTVMGTQPLRWKLTESLEVSIADFELVEGAAVAGRAAGLHEGKYTNAEYGFQLDLPDERWTIEDNSSPGVLLLRLRPPEETLGDSVMFHVTAFNIPAGVPAKMLTDGRLNHHRSSLDDFELLIDEPTEVGGAKGHRVRFQGAPRNETASPLRVTEVLIISGESGLLLNLIATQELHERYLERFEGVLSTVSLMGE